MTSTAPRLACSGSAGAHLGNFGFKQIHPSKPSVNPFGGEDANRVKPSAAVNIAARLCDLQARKSTARCKAFSFDQQVYR